MKTSVLAGGIVLASMLPGNAAALAACCELAQAWLKVNPGRDLYAALRQELGPMASTVAFLEVWEAVRGGE